MTYPGSWGILWLCCTAGSAVMSAQPQPERPTPAELAATLLASLDLTTKGESELVAAAYRAGVARERAEGQQVELPPRLREVLEGRFRTLVDAHVTRLRKQGENRSIRMTGRLLTDLFISPGLRGQPEVTGLLEVRNQDARSIVWTGTRMRIIDSGVVLLKVRSVDGGTGLSLTPLFSPRGISSEVEKLTRLAAGLAGGTTHLEHLEGASFLYGLIRGVLAYAHPTLAPRERELRTIVADRSSVPGRFYIFLRPGTQFEVLPIYDPESCELSISSAHLPRPGPS